MGEQQLARRPDMYRHALAGRNGQRIFAPALGRRQHEKALLVDHGQLAAFAQFRGEPVEEGLRRRGQVDAAGADRHLAGQLQKTGAEPIGSAVVAAHHLVMLKRVQDPIDRRARLFEGLGEVGDAGAVRTAFQHSQYLHHPVDNRHRVLVRALARNLVHVTPELH